MYLCHGKIHRQSFGTTFWVTWVTFIRQVNKSTGLQDCLTFHYNVCTKGRTSACFMHDVRSKILVGEEKQKQDATSQQSPLAYSGFFLCLFCTMEFISDQAKYFPLPAKFPHFKRSNCFIVPPKEMLLSFSIGTFLTNYDITDRKLYYTLFYSIVQKQTYLRAE